MKPLIGITTAWSVETWNDSLESRGYNYVGRPYVEAIINAGGIPILLPQFDHNDIDKILDTIDGILFTGGGDAKKFSKEDLPSLREQQPLRYDFEMELMKHAKERKIPMLGICRGFQMMIEVFGGNLALETIDGHKQNLPGGKPWHRIRITEGSLLHEILNDLEWDVNSFHIQKVGQMPDSFIVSGIAEDGVIEAIESKEEQFMVGMQFHPEELLWCDKRGLSVFEEFIGVVNQRC